MANLSCSGNIPLIMEALSTEENTVTNLSSSTRALSASVFESAVALFLRDFKSLLSTMALIMILGTSHSTQEVKKISLG